LDRAEALYRKLISPIESRLVTVAGRLMPSADEAADALQDTLAWVWEHLERLDRHANPHGYIVRVCISRCYDALRRRSRRHGRERPLEGEAVASDPGSAAAESDGETARAVRLAVGRLPRQQALAVTLRLAESADYAAIARTLGCSEASARSHVSKGRVRLRRELARLGVRGTGEDRHG
jgi:RNA polymerase sigma factor (sigma-70 family)